MFIRPFTTMLLAALTGCAAAPAPTPVSAGASCAQLAAQRAEAEQAKAAAVEKADTAWKAVLPPAMLMRHATAKNELADADQRLVQIDAAMNSQRCMRHEG